MPSGLDIVPHSKYAIDAKGSYAFERGLGDEDGDDKPAEADAGAEPFSIEDARLKLPRGTRKSQQAGRLIADGLTCVTGRVGTGKSALLQGLLGEVRQVTGRTVFSGPVSYGVPAAFRTDL
jgi:ABC-type transport system involved in cytochrome bd biosynthesis fused ATPase/permease subunit